MRTPGIWLTALAEVLPWPLHVPVLWLIGLECARLEREMHAAAEAVGELWRWAEAAIERDRERERYMKNMAAVYQNQAAALAQLANANYTSYATSLSMNYQQSGIAGGLQSGLGNSLGQLLGQRF